MEERIKALRNGEVDNAVRNHLERLSSSLGIEKFSGSFTNKAIHILNSHNQTVERLKSPKFIELLKKERDLKGDTKLGYVLCVDGRLQSIHFGRTVNIWEEPAGLFDVQFDDNHQLIVASKELRKALSREAEDSREIFEMIFAHTSLKTNHICRYMAGDRRKKADEKMETDEELVKRNLRQIEDERIPAFTNTYNKARLRYKKEALKQVAVSALLDTDTMGVILNYGEKNQLSTTDLLETEGFKGKIQSILTGEENSFGFWRDKFTDPKEFLKYYKKIVDVTERILEDDNIGLNLRLFIYIKDNYPDLTDSQVEAFMFGLSRRLAFQYLTGLSKIPEIGHPDHPFADHKERFATISTSGEGVLDRFNVIEQSFGITSSNKRSAIFQATKVALPLLDKYDSDKKNHILFVSTPVGQDDDIDSLRDKNRDYFESLYQNDEIKKRVSENRLLLIPVLVKTTGEIIEIPQHIKSN